MLKRRTRVTAALAAPLLLTLGGPTLAASAATSPLVGQWPGGLRGVSTVSASHAWAIGNTETTGFLVYWNGREWQHSALVIPGRASVLTAIDARTANDIWVVGLYYPDASTRYRALIEHWDGGGWHLERGPAANSQLFSVSADSATDAWATGFGARGLILLHWDGSSWTRLVGEHCCPLGQVDAVKAISPTDAWAVGATHAGIPTFLTMHWNGVRWRKVPSAMPPGGLFSGKLQSVSASSATDVWAVGYYVQGGPVHSFIEHWDGQAWTHVAGPTRHERGSAILHGVTADAGTDAWTVGYRQRPSRTVTDRWDGTSWAEVESPDPGLLYAVDASSPSNAWAVGGRMGHTLIERWDGHNWSVS